MFLKTATNAKIGLKFLCVGNRSLSVLGRESVRDLGSKDGELRVFIVAGEVSGDIIASRFMNSLRKLSPFPVRFTGVGGKGWIPCFPWRILLSWAFGNYCRISPSLGLNQTVESALTFQPHVVLTVDSKGFSFRFLKHLRARYGPQGLATPQHFHYVAPSFWAWRGGESRLKGLVGFVDHLFCILPFEAQICRSYGLPATFVGHPALEDVFDLKNNKCMDREWKVQGDAEEFRKKYGVPSGSKIISVLPGSRVQEVTRMLPIYARTLELIKDFFSELTVVIHVAPNKHVQDYISDTVHKWPVPVVLVPGGSTCTKYNAFSASQIALCTSGTVAVEMQLARLPCVVAYRANILTERFIRYKAKVPYISLPNIVLDSPIIPETLFEACTPPQLAPVLLELMHDESLRQQQITAANKFLSLLNPQQKVDADSICNPSFEYTPSVVAASAVLSSTVGTSV
ncbi:probable lipid-A-disaccharide synthase, mitochondrial isoform X2 [Salvia splendens]|uniref:probable lipid-A-disaccharide synthase, mitochondrial isoform X2 n=1 Tax=Salvia splendens TaxID=180675 RepID=UPI001C277ED5|nr:probable lipid-A-disaccharide synthase, mitochondrial isoform X2 [Salvia splendens]